MTARKRTPMPSPTTLQFEPDTTLKVQVLPPPKVPAPSRKWLYPLIVGLVLAVGVYAFLATFYVFPRTYVPPTNVDGVSDVSISLSYPTYLAFGDTGEIDLTILNRGSAIITGTVVLEFTGTLPVRAVPSKSTSVELSRLGQGATLTERLSVTLNRPIWLRDETAQFRVLVEADGKRGALPDNYAVHAAPVPYLGTSLAWLPTGSVLLSGLLSFLWDTFKKRVLGVEGK